MRTRKNFSMNSKSKSKSKSAYKKYTKDKIVSMFLQMLNTVKLYHWKTKSYSQHIATDTLYSDINSSVDTFVEILLGKTGERVNLTKQRSLPLVDFNNVDSFKKEVEKYKDFLIGMSNDSNLSMQRNTDLLNTRDELLGHLNKFSYLLTFDK